MNVISALRQISTKKIGCVSAAGLLYLVIEFILLESGGILFLNLEPLIIADFLQKMYTTVHVIILREINLFGYLDQRISVVFQRIFLNANWGPY